MDVYDSDGKLVGQLEVDPTTKRLLVDVNGGLTNDAASLSQVIKTVAAAGTPEAIAASSTKFRTAVIMAKKAARTDNTGTVYLGVTSGNDTQPIELISGSTWTITAPAGQVYDLADWYVDVVTAADGVVVIYS